MSSRSIASGNARLSWSLLFAAALAAIGLLRLFSDFLTDIDPTWVSCLGDSPLRLLARTTDGSVAGNLNVQYFKVMAIPCGLAVLFLVNGGLTGGIAAAEMQVEDPARTAARWGEIAEIPVVNSPHPTLTLDNAALRFVPIGDGRGEGLGGLDLATNDRAGILAAAHRRGTPVNGNQVYACGMRFNLL